MMANPSPTPLLFTQPFAKITQLMPRNFRCSQFCCSFAKKVVLAGSALLLLQPLAEPTRAEGLLYQLPKDGSWSTFEYVNNGKNKGSFWIASVGEVKIEGKACRWIELRMDEATLNRPIKKTFKVLVPEEHLGTGKRPLDHVIQGWTKSGDSKAQKFDPKSLKGGHILFLLAPPLEKVETLGEVEVTSKLGTVKCPSVRQSGKLLDSQVVFETRLNSKSPFGVVTCQFTQKVEGRGESVLEMKLSDFGEGAKSVIAEQE